MSRRKDAAASRPDDDNPEWTRDDMRNARPALEVIAEIFGPDAAERFAIARSGPPKPDRKVNQHVRLDHDVLEAYRHLGSGWQTRINEVLREHMPKRQE